MQFKLLICIHIGTDLETILHHKISLEMRNMSDGIFNFVYLMKPIIRQIFESELLRTISLFHICVYT